MTDPPLSPTPRPVASRRQNLLRLVFATVWILNGLFAKVLLLVPRHAEIVARILGSDHALLLTRLIGLGEILLAAWILSGWSPRACAALQIALIMAMNVIEQFLAPDLLLFGRWNLLWATALAACIAWNEWTEPPRQETRP
ncbi:MAG: DoxX-like family protein [Verrucomicrobiia bacterium]